MVLSKIHRIRYNQEFHKGLAVAQQLQIGRVVSKIDSDGAVFAGPFGGFPHVSPPGSQVV